MLVSSGSSFEATKVAATTRRLFPSPYLSLGPVFSMGVLDGTVAEDRLVQLSLHVDEWKETAYN